jgi:hypothetical protein
MILTTIVASTTYAWIEGFALTVPAYGSEAWKASQNMWLLGHFSTYSVAMGILFACITGGFGLLQARSMFTRGKRYFLFTVAGNYPFAWFVEDFAFFWFYPDARLNDTAWSDWAFGGFWLLDPWRSGVKIWIPNWYWIVLLFWAGMMWFAHRCTVYDNLVKDEIAREIVPRKIEIPHVEVKKPVRIPEEVVRKKVAEEPARGIDKRIGQEAAAPKAEQVTVEPPAGPREVPQAPTEAPQPEQPPTEQPTLEPRKRSPEAEEALQRLRKKWVRNADDSAA